MFLRPAEYLLAEHLHEICTVAYATANAVFRCFRTKNKSGVWKVRFLVFVCVVYRLFTRTVKRIASHTFETHNEKNTDITPTDARIENLQIELSIRQLKDCPVV